MYTFTITSNYPLVPYFVIGLYALETHSPSELMTLKITCYPGLVLQTESGCKNPNVIKSVLSAMVSFLINLQG